MSMHQKTLTFFCTVLILASFADPSPGFSRVPQEPDVAPDKVLVKFHDDVDQNRIAEIVESAGGTIRKVLASTGVHIISLAEGVAVADAVEKYSSYKEVRYAEPVERALLLEDK